MSFIAAGRTLTRGFSTSAIKRADVAKMTLIGRLGATPEAIKDKQGRDLLVYSVATLDRAQVNSDGSKADPSTTWHRVLSYQANGREYLSTLPKGTLVHIEADFKKRTNKDDSGNYTEQTLLLLDKVNVLSKPKGAEEASTEE